MKRGHEGCDGLVCWERDDRGCPSKKTRIVVIVLVAWVFIAPFVIR